MLISVVMAAYNAELFVNTAIRSVLSQNYSDFELIITDDCSSDGTANVLQKAADDDPRIRILRHETRKGPGAARNTAIRAASGDWIAILDSDDEFAPDRLRAMIERVSVKELDLLADNLALVDFVTHHPLGQAFPDEWMDSGSLIDLAWIIERDWPGQVTPMPFGFAKPLIRKSFLDTHRIDYDEKVDSGEDLLLYCDALNCGGRFGLMKEALYIYSIRTNSTSRKNSAAISLCIVNEKILAKSVSSGDISVVLRKRGDALQYEVFSQAWKRGDFLLAADSTLRISFRYMLARVTKSAQNIFRSKLGLNMDKNT